MFRVALIVLLLQTWVVLLCAFVAYWMTNTSIWQCPPYMHSVANTPPGVIMACGYYGAAFVMWLFTLLLGIPTAFAELRVASLQRRPGRQLTVSDKTKGL